MSEPKPGKTRQAETEARKRAAGLVRVCFWVHADNAAQFRADVAPIADAAALRAKPAKRGKGKA